MLANARIYLGTAPSLTILPALAIVTFILAKPGRRNAP